MRKVFFGPPSGAGSIRLRVVMAGAAMLLATAAALAQREGLLELGGEWRTDEIELTDRRTLRGLVEEETPQWVRFLEVRRRPGRPVTLVGHYLSRQEIVRMARLSDADRGALRERLEAIRNRAAIEAGRIQNVKLTKSERDGIPCWSYGGPWFRLEASLDANEVRRIVVRLEQVFRAFEQVLPPVEGASPTGGEAGILVFGDHREYAGYLRRNGLAIRNPAFFDARKRQVVVSSNLGRLLDRARVIEDEHLLRLQKLFPEDQEVAAALAERERVLKAGDHTDSERKRLLFLTLHRWRQDEDALLEQMRQVERQNSQAIQAEREGLEQRLFHEAFHAYADACLAPAEDQHMPLWLSEGLAQLFEKPLFDAGRMRIDTPDPERLDRLREDLRSADPLTLRDLLSADQRRFLVAHDASGRTSERHYLYAWGVAYDLAFAHPSLTRERFGAYLSEAASTEIAAFERLVQMPLDAYEARWREQMRELAAKGAGE